MFSVVNTMPAFISAAVRLHQVALRLGCWQWRQAVDVRRATTNKVEAELDVMRRQLAALEKLQVGGWGRDPGSYLMWQAVEQLIPAPFSCVGAGG